MELQLRPVWGTGCGVCLWGLNGKPGVGKTANPNHYRENSCCLKHLLQAAHRQEGRREPVLLPPARRAASTLYTDRAQRRPSPCTTKVGHTRVALESRDKSLVTGTSYKCWY